MSGEPWSKDPDLDPYVTIRGMSKKMDLLESQINQLEHKLVSTTESRDLAEENGRILSAKVIDLEEEITRFRETGCSCRTIDQFGSHETTCWAGKIDEYEDLLMRGYWAFKGLQPKLNERGEAWMKRIESLFGPKGDGK